MEKPKQKTTASQEVVEIAIDGLQSYSKQAEIFGDISDAELQALAIDIDEHGQRQPIEVLPDHTILAGHQRVRALKSLGRSTVRAIVRHDLVGKPIEITEFFISDNLNRRHLNPLAIARCYQALRHPPTTVSSDRRSQRAELNRAASVARLASIGCHLEARSLNRYVKLLELPRPIQDAIIAKRITMRDGASLLDRSPSQRLLIAEACKNGKSKVELAEMIREMRGKPRPISTNQISISVGALASLSKSSSQVRNIAYSFARDMNAIKRFKNAKKAIDKILTIMLAQAD